MVSPGPYCGSHALHQSKFRRLEYVDVHDGVTLFAAVGAFLVVLELPLIGRLTTMIQARHIIAFGWMMMALAKYLSTQRTDLFISFGSAAWLRVAQAVPIGLIFIPVTAVAYIGIPPEKSNTVSAMVNFMRNIGASVGTSLVMTLVARRAQFHQMHLISRLAATIPCFTISSRL